MEVSCSSRLMSTLGVKITRRLVIRLVATTDVYKRQGCIELHHENVEKKAGRQEADALIHRIINLTDALDALAHDAVTHAHHHDRETDVRNETMRERTRKEGSYGIQQNGIDVYKRQSQECAYRRRSGYQSDYQPPCYLHPKR